MWILAAVSLVLGFIIGYAVRAARAKSSVRELARQIKRLDLGETSELVVVLEQTLGVSAQAKMDEEEQE